MSQKMRFKGRCPDYVPDICDVKLGVYVCWKYNEHSAYDKRTFLATHKEYKCPIIDYGEVKEQ